ncbi:MAG TPA: ABC transporter substrate-binding protein [Arenibaculum sp.]|nr:ABC transporter substrate-binding protein [Arenibaculum sp.]
MNAFARRLGQAASALCIALAFAAGPGAASAQDIRVAFGDIPTVESLHFLIAVERAREKGVDIQVTNFKSEDIAAQAVVTGQADIGVGTPYPLLQKVKAPIRLFQQMSTLRFYPVVNTEFYTTWKDLDGQEIAVHSRGSGTEAIMQLMADRNDIEYGNISYVPGSEVRAGALLQGNIKVTVLDSTNRRIVEERAPGKFAVLPMEEVDATDEALFANVEFLEENQEAVDILVESLLTTIREINDDPAVVAELREQYGLLPDLPEELEADIGPYFEEAVATGSLSPNGGGEEAARSDFDFYGAAGELQGDPETLKVEDFWDLRPLERALDKLGRV